MEAYQMIINTLKWRETNYIDRIFTRTYKPNDWVILGTHLKLALHKVDKENRPVFYFHPGKSDFIELRRLLDDYTLTIMFIQLIEYMCKIFPPHYNTKYGDNNNPAMEKINNILVVTNLDGFSVSQVLAKDMIEFCKVLLDTVQNYYPECLEKVYLVNVPLSYYLFWNLIKGFVDARTRSKIQILRHNYRSELLKVIDEENLPLEFGGRCVCHNDDGTCLSNKNHPIAEELIPFHQYLYENAEHVAHDD